MKAIFYKFQRFFWWFWVCFTTAAFDTDTFQHAILDQNELKAKLSCIWWYDYFVCGVNRFRVMIDFLRDGSACPVFCKTLPAFSGLNVGDMFQMFDMLY